MTTTVASARVAAPAAASIAEQALLHRERTRVQTKDKKDRSNFFRFVYLRKKKSKFKFILQVQTLLLK